MSLYGTVEIGGTKTDVAVGTAPGDMSEPRRIETTTPSETLEAVAEALSEHELSAVGIASFGPLDLDPSSRRHGTMLATPKPGWSGADVLGSVRDRLDRPIAIDTDVNGAALGEGQWGATSGMAHHAYMTVGTGVGVGIVVDGRLVHGTRHPEVGHLAVSRLDGDEHPGSCPYHGDCLEGMAAGPALEARFGAPATWEGNENVVALATTYIAQGLRSLLYTVSPERIVVGGGASALPGFHDLLRLELGRSLARYPIETDLDLLVSKPGLGTRSGLAGGLILAERALRRARPQT